MKPICVRCQLFYSPEKNGYPFLEGMPQAPLGTHVRPGKATPQHWRPYKLWIGNLWQCRGCGHEIIVGVMGDRLAEHYEPTFAKESGKVRCNASSQRLLRRTSVMSAEVIVRLSATGEGLEVEMPSGHTVNVPVNEKGVRFIFMVLTEQEISRQAGRPTGIDTAASPTQTLVNKWLKSNEVKRFTEKGEAVKETLTLEDLGL